MDYKIKVLTKEIENDNYKIFIDYKHIEKQIYESYNLASSTMSGIIERHRRVHGIDLCVEDFEIVALQDGKELPLKQ
tara:strand:- start:42 stop:272 length:231 start_codon:yes stop_codon:yes gene_type:complete